MENRFRAGKFLAQMLVPAFMGAFAFESAHAQSCNAIFSVEVAAGQPSEILIDKMTQLQGALVETKIQLKSGDVKALQGVLDRDVRGTTFAIEAILRLYTKSSEFKETFSKADRKALEKNLEEVKALEDQIGAYSLSKEILAVVKNNPKIDAEFIQFLENNTLNAEATFRKFLKEEKWTKKSSKKSNELIEELQAIKWPSATKDLNYVKAALKEYVASSEAKIETKLKPMILAKKYGFEELEYGVHEWRRNLRWIPITLLAMKSQFKYSNLPSPLSAAEQALVAKYKDSKFTQLAGKSGESIELPPIALYQISKLISDIGKAKDSGEAAHYLTGLYVKHKAEQGVKINDEQAHQYIDSLLNAGTDVGVEQRVHEIFREFEQTRPLGEIIRALE